MDRRELRIGELAKRTGISVRTLHHYHDLGLLVPSLHSPGSHRLYTAEDLERLLKIRALKQLGLSLTEIARCLDEAVTLTEVLDRHAAAVRERLAAAARVAERLDRVRERLSRESRPSVDRLIETLEVIEMHEKYFDEEQRKQLEERRAAVGDERIRAVQEEWSAIFAALREAIDAGKAPDDPEVREVVRRGRALVREFTGGDSGLTRSLGEMYANEPAPHAIAGTDAEVWAFYGEASARLDD